MRGFLPAGDTNRWADENHVTRNELIAPPIGFEQVWPSLSAFDRVSALELRGYMLNQLLRDSDVFSMANSIELRVPLLDQRLVELAYSIPSGLKDGLGKKLLKEALQPVLPAHVMGRPKQGFSFPYPLWLHDTFGDLVYQRAVAAAARQPGIRLTELVETTWSRFRKRKIGWTPVWAVSMLALYADRYEF